MKRIISAALCVIFSVGLFAQNAIIIHMKDGTKKEFPIKAVGGLDFVGKAKVNDGEYTSISGTNLYSGANLDIKLTVAFHTDDPFIGEATPQYGNNCGVLYSTTPNVTIETGELIQMTDNRISAVTNLANASFDAVLGNSAIFEEIKNSYPVDLEFETTYYFRSFVRNMGSSGPEYFYSNEVSVNTGKPSMAYYGVTVDPASYAETGYIMPTDSAWASFAERYPYFTVKDGCKDAISECWHFYMKENIATLKSQCSTVYECREGTLYILDNISDDFGDFALEFYKKEFTTIGFTEDYRDANDVVIICDTTWGFIGNRYYEYRPIAETSLPEATIKLGEPLLANYNYKFEIMLAPDVTGADTLATKYSINFKCLNEVGKKVIHSIAKNQITNIESATVATIDSISTGNFGEASIVVKASASRKEIRNKEYSTTLRIAQIKVIPMGPINKDEE